VKIPRPSDLKAAQEMVKVLLPAAREMNEALENLAEVHARWNTGATRSEVDAAIQRVLDARVMSL
jgi:hypothetical protein